MNVLHLSDLHYGTATWEEVDRCMANILPMSAQADLVVVTGDATDHVMHAHNPAVRRLFERAAQLAENCPVVFLQGTFDHEPVGFLALATLMRTRHPVLVLDAYSQAILIDGQFVVSDGLAFDETDPRLALATALISAAPTTNKAELAARAGTDSVGQAYGAEVTAILSRFGPSNRVANRLGIPTLLLGHGTVSGARTEHGMPLASFDNEFSLAGLFSSQARAIMLGHIHQHQGWDNSDGQRIAYAGNIARLVMGDQTEKGVLMWHIGAEDVRYDVVPSGARGFREIAFDAMPDLDAIRELAAQSQGQMVRVTYRVDQEFAHEVPIMQIRQILAGCAQIAIKPIVGRIERSRASGINGAHDDGRRLQSWADATGTELGNLPTCLGDIKTKTVEQIVEQIVQ